LAQNRDIVKRTFEFAVQIIELAGELSRISPSGRTLSSQILRSGTSIGANVEEGQAAESKADFAHKYNLALKEARETKYWLKLVNAAKVARPANLDGLIKECDEISKIIAQIIINARKAK
jgi:four helix bundle protein